MFAHEAVDALERPADILGGVRVSQAQEAAAALAEGGSGQYRHACLLEQAFCKLTLVHAGRFNVGKDVEGSLWPGAGKAVDRVQAVDKQVAAALELPPHALDRALGVGCVK